jgi:hypothetical protein
MLKFDVKTVTRRQEKSLKKITVDICWLSLIAAYYNMSDT